MTSPVFVDLYSKDVNGKPNINALAAAGRPWCGIGFKVSEGTYYPSESQAIWLNTYWQQGRVAAGVRYGQDWFRWGYQYFRVGEDPLAQAELYLKTIENAGGWGPGDLWPMVDVETAENPPNGPKQLVIDGLSAYAGHIKRLHGRAPVLYAGSYFRDLGIKDHCGCQYLSTAAYGSTLPARLYLDMGWPLDKLLDWQYQGTEGFSGPKGYPRISPIGAGPVDLSALTICNGATPDEQLAWIRAHISC